MPAMTNTFGTFSYEKPPQFRHVIRTVIRSQELSTEVEVVEIDRTIIERNQILRRVTAREIERLSLRRVQLKPRRFCMPPTRD